MARIPRQASPVTLRRLRQLLDAVRAGDTARSELYLTAWRAHTEEDASLGQLAKAMGVGRSTVKGWVDRGAQLIRDERG